MPLQYGFERIKVRILYLYYPLRIGKDRTKPVVFTVTIGRLHEHQFLMISYAFMAKIFTSLIEARMALPKHNKEFP